MLEAIRGQEAKDQCTDNPATQLIVALQIQTERIQGTVYTGSPLHVFTYLPETKEIILKVMKR